MDPPAGPTRRAVLGIAVSVGAAGVVTGCGGGEDTAGPAGSSRSVAAENLISAADVPVGGG